jgi:gluconolactonase
MNLYPPPKDVETEVWTEIPDKFKKERVYTPWIAANKFGHDPHSFLEGPSFDRDGNLYVVDIPFGRVFRISPDKEWTLITEYDGEPNGLKIHKDGRIFIADYKNGILQLDPASGTVTPYCERWRVESFKGVNDLVFDALGNMYFTDQGLTGMHDPSGRVFRLSPDGSQLDCLINTVPSPNGLVPNLSEDIIYLAVTRANQVWRVPLLDDGGTAKVGIFLQLSGGHGGPDGMALDTDGGLVVCHAGNGSVWHFDPMGEPKHRIRSCSGLNTTNLAFGGPGNKSLFITESMSGTILRAKLPDAGKVMYSHMD